MLTIEDDNKHTPSISLDDEVKDMSEDESGQSQQQSHNSDHSENESESKKESLEKIIDQVIHEIEMLEERKNNGTKSDSEAVQHSHNMLD